MADQSTHDAWDADLGTNNQGMERERVDEFGLTDLSFESPSRDLLYFQCVGSNRSTT